MSQQLAVSGEHKRVFREIYHLPLVECSSTSGKTYEVANSMCSTGSPSPSSARRAPRKQRDMSLDRRHNPEMTIRHCQCRPRSTFCSTDLHLGLDQRSSEAPGPCCCMLRCTMSPQSTSVQILVCTTVLTYRHVLTPSEVVHTQVEPHDQIFVVDTLTVKEFAEILLRVHRRV